MENLKELKGAKVLSKNEQKTISGGYSDMECRCPEYGKYECVCGHCIRVGAPIPNYRACD